LIPSAWTETAVLIELLAGDRWNAGEALLERAAAHGARPLLRGSDETWSGAELRERALAVQDRLQTRGFRPGDRLLLLFLDRPAFHAAFLGALRAGVIPIPISTLLPPKDISFIAHDAEVRGAWIDPALSDALTDAALFPTGTEVERRSTAAFRSRGTETPAADTRAGDDAFWLYTSGTTGEPKGVIHRHLDLPVTAECYAGEVLRLEPADCLFSAAKLFFAYGLGNGLTFPLWYGAEVILWADRPTPEAVFEILERERPTIFFGVPTLYAALLAHPAAPAALPSLRLCVSAGEALAAPLYERWRERYGVEILDGIGSTEMLHIFVSNRAGRVRPGSSGTPVPGYRVRVVDEESLDVAPGKVGTLLAFGESAARAYHNRPEQSARTMFEPGWLRSGDSYRVESDGTYTHVGRTDDLLKVSGQYVSPVEVEATLAAHPAVLESAVVGWADENGLVTPKAFVVPKPGHRASGALARDLQSFVKGELAPHKYPRTVEFVASLPKTATGKIRRFALRKR